MALDEPQQDDTWIETDGINFVLSRKDHPYMFDRGTLLVEFIEAGSAGWFRIRTMRNTGCGC